jgi:hypothetical protein
MWRRFTTLLSMAVETRKTTSKSPEASKAVYLIAYKVKFASKRELGRDFAVPPTRGALVGVRHELIHHTPGQVTWDWTAMIIVPRPHHLHHVRGWNRIHVSPVL